jgi:predicted phosphate transport protein (TIGR00153 family)
MRSLASLLGRSPFGPLQEHMNQVVQCAEAVPALFAALIAGDREALLAQQKHIAALESEADLIKNELRNHLPRKLFMPVDRRDLLEILDLQDTIADVAEDIGDLLIAREFEIPEAMAEPLLRFVDRAVSAAVAGREVVKRLDGLLEVGFAGPESEEVLALIDHVLTLEDEADVLELEVTRALFANESEFSPVSVILWMRLFDWVGDLADYPKKVCNRLRLLIAS